MCQELKIKPSAHTLQFFRETSKARRIYKITKPKVIAKFKNKGARQTSGAE
jgi:hypothetical protein